MYLWLSHQLETFLRIFATLLRIPKKSDKLRHSKIAVIILKFELCCITIEQCVQKVQTERQTVWICINTVCPNLTVWILRIIMASGSMVILNTKIHEPHHEKTCLQGLRPVETQTVRSATETTRVLKFPLEQVEVLYYPGSKQQRCWSDCADAQADLRLCCLHMAYTGFLKTWLTCSWKQIPQLAANISLTNSPANNFTANELHNQLIQQPVQNCHSLLFVWV